MGNLRITLRQLQVFVAVARTGTTSAAGDEIALSQSATSAALNDLERALKMPLFDRVGKRLVLNANGRIVQQQAQSLLDNAAQLERLGQDGLANRQALKIGASTTIGDYVLPGLLQRFYGHSPQEMPAWHSTVHIDNTAEISARVAAHQLDIGLIEGVCHESTLQAHPWVRDRMVLLVAGNAGQANAGPTVTTGSVSSNSTGNPTLSLEQLKDAVWLVREPGSGTREVSDHALLPSLGSYRRRIELASTQAILHAVASGMGIACLSAWAAAEGLANGQLHIAQTPLPALSRQWYWVVRSDKPVSGALRRFVRLLEVFRLKAEKGP